MAIKVGINGFGRIGRNIKITIVAAKPVDGICDRPPARLDDTSAENAGDTTFVLDARRHAVL